MDFKSRNTKIMSALILIAAVIIFTIGRCNGSGGVSVTIGVDEEKVGIVTGDADAVFISLEDLETASLADSESAGVPAESVSGDTVTCGADGVTRIFLGNADAKEFLILDSTTGNYIVGAQSKSTVENAYKQLPDSVKQ